MPVIPLPMYLLVLPFTRSGSETVMTGMKRLLSRPNLIVLPDLITIRQNVVLTVAMSGNATLTLGAVMTSAYEAPVFAICRARSL